MLRLICGLLSLVCLVGVVAAAEPSKTDPSPSTVKAQELIRKLRDDRFGVRESAANQLIAMGREAKIALLAAREDSDAEVAERCRKILPVAISQDLKLRVEAFLADKDMKKTHDLPGWERYQKLIGKDKDSQDLFVAMIKSNAPLFESIELDPERAPVAYANRCFEMIQYIFGRGGKGNQGPDLGDLVTLFFFGLEPEYQKALNANQQFNVYIGNVLYQPAFQNSIRDATKGIPMRKLFVMWMEGRSDQNTVSQALSIVQQFNIKEGVEFASKAMRDKNHPAYLRSQASTLVGKMGGKERIADFEALLEDDTQIQAFQNLKNKNGVIQMGDVSLAMVVHLSGQKPKEFGFEFLDNDYNLWSYYFLGFENDEKRLAAKKKWKSWVEEQKKKK